MADAPSTPLPPLIEAWMADRDDDWSDRTRMKMRNDTNRFLAWLTAEQIPAILGSLTRPIIKAYRRYLTAKPAQVRGFGPDKGAAPVDPTRTLAPDTIHNYLSGVRAFCSYLVEEEIAEASPFTGARVMPKVDPRDRILKCASVSDYEIALRGCRGSRPIDRRDRAIVELIWTTGMRAGEVGDLRLEHVDLKRNVVSIYNAKGKKDREVPLLPEAKAAMLQYLHLARPKLLPHYGVRGYEDQVLGRDPGWFFVARRNGRGVGGQHLGTEAISGLINKRYHAGGGDIASFRPHRLRHGIGSHLINECDVPLEVVATLFGHSDMRTTRDNYLHRSTDALGRQVSEGLDRGGRRRSRRAA